jgi:hypothetical protein
VYGADPAGGDAELVVGVNLEPDPQSIPAPMVIPRDDPAPGHAVQMSDFPIGMDDPTLASKIRKKGFTADGESAAPAYGSDTVQQPEETVEAPAENVQDEQPVRAGQDEQPHSRVKDNRPGFGAFMMVTGLPTAMAAGAWQLSTTLGEDPVNWTTPAGVLGLLFSWLWVRWKYRGY